MAINPNLLVIKPVNELESVTGLQAGELLFYDGSNNLKKIDIDTFNNLSKTAKPLKPTDPTPTEEGLYMPTEAGTYANAGGLIAQEGYYTLFFFDATTWTKSEIKLPQGGDTTDLNKVLKSFVTPTEVDWTDITMPYSGEEDNNYLLKTPFLQHEYNINLANGAIPIADLAGFNKFRLQGDLALVGDNIVWIGARTLGGSYVSLASGIIQGSVEIDIDPTQYDIYYYSRLKADTVISKGVVNNLPIEDDSVKKFILSQPKGNSIYIDTGLLGVSPTNSAGQNTAIIQKAINDAYFADHTGLEVVIPGGRIPVNRLLLKPLSKLRGAGDTQTRLYCPTPNAYDWCIQKEFGNTDRVEVSDLMIEAGNYVFGGIKIENSFDLKLERLFIKDAKINSIALIACLYHKLSDLYLEGGDTSIYMSDITTMRSNLCYHERVYISKFKKHAVYNSGGSSFYFINCNFENGGTGGDLTTGGVYMEGLGSGGEGVGATFVNCWSEGVKGGFVYKFVNCKGSNTLISCMMGNGGIGVGPIANALINDDCKVILSAGTRFSEAPDFMPYPVSIRTQGNGSTLIENPHINVGVHIEEGAGVIRYATYS